MKFTKWNMKYVLVGKFHRICLVWLKIFFGGYLPLRYRIITKLHASDLKQRDCFIEHTIKYFLEETKCAEVEFS
jgi:hypothetical protein